MLSVQAKAFIMMDSIKKILRFLVLTVLIILALSGIGIFGNFLNTNREPYRDRELRVEQIDRKKDEEDGEDESKN